MSLIFATAMISHLPAEADTSRRAYDVVTYIIFSESHSLNCRPLKTNDHLDAETTCRHADTNQLSLLQ